MSRKAQRMIGTVFSQILRRVGTAAWPLCDFDERPKPVVVLNREPPVGDIDDDVPTGATTIVVRHGWQDVSATKALEEDVLCPGEPRIAWDTQIGLHALCLMRRGKRILSVNRCFLDSMAVDGDSSFRLEFAGPDGERVHVPAIVIDGLADDRVAVVRIPEHLLIDGSQSLYEEMLLAFDAAVRRDSVPWRDDPSIFSQGVRCIEYSHKPLDLKGIKTTADPATYDMWFTGDAERET